MLVRIVVCYIICTAIYSLGMLGSSGKENQPPKGQDDGLYYIKPKHSE